MLRTTTNIQLMEKVSYCKKERDLLHAGDSAAEGLDIYFGVPGVFPDTVLTILPNRGGYLLPFDKLLG